MTFPANPVERFPKGDHNRRIALDIGREAFAAEAGLSPEQVRRYEETPPDGDFDIIVAQRYGETLERLEGLIRPRVDNGPSPARI